MKTTNNYRAAALAVLVLQTTSKRGVGLDASGFNIQKASHGGGEGSKGKGHDQSKYESTAAGLGGGGGLGGLGSGDGRWGDGLAKVLERGVGLDAAGFDKIKLASHGGGGGKGKGHDQSKYESTAAGLGGEGGGGGEGSGDGQWGDGSAKVLERGVGLDAAEFDTIKLATHGGGGSIGKGHDKKFMHEFSAAGLGGEGMEGGGGLLGGLAGWSNWSDVGGGGNSDVNFKWSDGVGLDSLWVELGQNVCGGKEERTNDSLASCGGGSDAGGEESTGGWMTADEGCDLDVGSEGGDINSGERFTGEGLNSDEVNLIHESGVGGYYPHGVTVSAEKAEEGSGGESGYGLGSNDNPSLKVNKASGAGGVDCIMTETVDKVHTSIKATKDMPRKSDYPNFLFQFAALNFVIIAAVSYLAYPWLIIMAAQSIVGMLSSTFARSSVLYDHGCKTLRAILKSASSLLTLVVNYSRGKSRRGRGQDKGKSTIFCFLVSLFVFSAVDIGEAHWFTDTNDGGVVDSVKELFDDGNLEGVIMTDLQSGSSIGQDTTAQTAPFNKVQKDQVILDSFDGVKSDDIGIQDYGGNEIISFQNEIHGVHSELQKIASDVTVSDQDVLKATSKALSLAKDRMVDLVLSASMPGHLQRILEIAVNQITNTEKHMIKAEGFASQYSRDGLSETKLEMASESSTHRNLLSTRSSAKYHFNSGVSKADHHHRAMSRHQGHRYHFNLDGPFGYRSGNQQGYRNERISREEGTTSHRRLQATDTGSDVCLPASRGDRKIEQCLRLAICAREYSLYDTFAFFFADDFDFNTGELDENIQVEDVRNLEEKLARIRGSSEEGTIGLSGKILEQYTLIKTLENGEKVYGLPLKSDTPMATIPSDPDKVPIILLNEEDCDGLGLDENSLCGKCDELLQEFYRFDEGIGLDGKWAGASVTGVCRGWGSTKFVSLESIYEITAENLNGKAQVEACLENEVAAFNKGSRNGAAELITSPAWCSGSNSFRFEVNNDEYCASSSDLSEPCSSSFNSCANLADCCTTTNKCGLGAGHCGSNTDCGAGLVCGTNNCKSDFGWQNGVEEFDCCKKGADYDKDNPPAIGGCVDSNCKCSSVDTAAYIDSTGDICQSSSDSGCRIDPSIVIFDVPTGDICKTQLDADNLFQDASSTKSKAQADINAAFKCLYYSAFVNSYNEGEYDCDSLFIEAKKGECESACNGQNDPIFEVKDRDSTTKVGKHFNYDVPTFLPPREERTGRDNKGQLSGGESLGEFVPFDSALAATDETAAEFTVEVFEEFMTCATNLVLKLDPNNKLFSGDNGGNNPYAPDDDNQYQFYLPLDILDAATDNRGQILGQFLDELFDYVPYGNDAGIETASGGSLKFSKALRELFIEAFVFNSVTEKIEVYQKCVDDTSAAQLNNCCKKGTPTADPLCVFNPCFILCDCDGPEKRYELEDTGYIGLCEGNCNSDSQCAPGLKCFKRGSDGPNPPGCGGSESGSTDFCYDPFCEVQLNQLEAIRDDLSDQGLASSTFFDNSIALLFGNGTTIGQVCSYSRGLEEELVNEVPGFCCLDAPYQSKDWGETYTCQKFIPDPKVDATGTEKTIIVQKGPGDCNRLGPVTAGFNQAACDIFYGQWCPNPRDCKVLVNCIKDEIKELKDDENRKAFLEYLNEAPKLKPGEVTDPTKCGDLRQYFEYDKNYADDDRICEEVKDLKCLTDFSNLDGLATGVPGADKVNADVQLAVSEKVTTIPAGLEGFNGDLAKAWRNTIFVLKQAFEFFDQIEKTAAEPAKELCSIIPLIVVAGNGVDPKPVCIGPAVLAKTVLITSKFIFQTAFSISDQLYSEVVDGQNAKFAGERTNAIYENSILNARNIITVFYATQQLKVMLGDISEGLEGDREERDERRRLTVTKECVYTEEFGLYEPFDSECTCVLTNDDGFQRGCNISSCEDPTFVCDGSYNYTYISKLLTAGCDDLDSDGDKKIDICEDRYPPNIVLRNAEIFRCDDDDTTRLCYTDKWFKNEKQVLNFLEYQFPAADDCAPTTKLNVKIDYERGECRDTVYRLQPFQDYPDCNNLADVGPFNLTFQNPLPGAAKNVTVQLDDEAPIVECGFFVPNDNSINVVNDKTLYHYMLKTEGGGRRLNDARLKDSGFFYNVTENCDADVQVDVVVKSNELQQNTVAQLFKRERTGFVEQAEFLYAPTHCDCEKKVDGLCKTDASMGDLKTRYYDVTITASDSAGNIGSDTCRVVIVPSCDPETDSDSICEEYNRPGLPNVEDFYYSIAAVNASVTQSQVLNQVAREELTWESGLATLDPDVVIEEAVDIDVDSPVVECGFIPNVKSINKVEGNTLYHFMSKADGDGNRLEDARFFYNLTENCEEDVHVNVVVKSNEIQQNKINIAELFKRKREGIVEQLDVLYAPTRCGCENKGFDGLCRPDPTMGDLKTRFYDIEVTASDFAGNAASVTCKVVIVPNCIPDSDPGCDNQIGSTFYYNISDVDESVMMSTVRYEIDEEKLTWERGLDLPTFTDELGEAVDIDVDPPVVTCNLGTQGLTGTGAGVFTDLGFNFTAVDGGKKCTDTKDLALTIEVLSNEVVTTGDDMVILSEPHGTAGKKVPSIWAEDHTCKSDNNGKCKVSSPKKSREYVVRVTATDEAGNIGIGECNTLVGSQVVDGSDPIFLLTKLDMVGGVEPNEASKLF